jgi:hypothetical protein
MAEHSITICDALGSITRPSKKISTRPFLDSFKCPTKAGIKIFLIKFFSHTWEMTQGVHFLVICFFFFQLGKTDLR